MHKQLRTPTNFAWLANFLYKLAPVPVRQDVTATTRSINNPFPQCFTLLLLTVAWLSSQAAWAQVRSPDQGRSLTTTLTSNEAVNAVTTVATAGSIVISQVYGGNGGTYQNDYVELFNRGGSPVSVNGWSIQYTSATGTGNFAANGVASLTGTIGPGSYYLVQLIGSTSGSPLPVNPDITNTAINLSGTAGKVVLVNSTTGLPCNGGSTPCSTSLLAQIVDLVGYGNANFYEGSAAATAPSATSAIFRASNGCTDTNQNGADFTAAAPAPRNSASPTNLCAPAQPALVASPDSRTGANGLSYTEGGGPAFTQLSLSGSGLTPVSGTITATASTTAFTVMPSSISYAGSSLPTTTLTVSLRTGLTAGIYPGTISVQGGGVSVVIPVSGTVNGAMTPVLTVNPATLGGFSTTQGTPSAAQSYTLSAQNLPGQLTVAVPTGVEISTAVAGPYVTSLTLGQSTVSAELFTRLIGNTVGSVNGTITNVSGSLSVNVGVTGVVNSVPVNPTAIGLSGLCTPYTQDFTSLASTGTTNTVLPAGWFLSKANGQYAADNGSSNSGNVYSYGALNSTDRSFGTLASNALVPTIGAAFVNNTGATITSLNISYVGKQWRLGAADREDRLDFQYSTSATSLTVSSGWVDVDELDFKSPTTTGEGAKDGNDPSNQSNISYSITGLTVPNGATFWIRLNDPNLSGADDGLAIDDFSISPSNNATCSELSVSPSPVSLAYTVNGGPASQTLTVTGSNLNPESGSVSIISSNTAIQLSYNGSAFGNSVSVPYSNSGLSATLAVQLIAGLPVGTYPASVSFAGGGTAFLLSVNGTVSSSAVSGTATLISTIQGSGSTFALGGVRTVEGIVVRAFPGSAGLNGFYLQEEDADSDGNPATSEGIFIYDPSSLFTGSVGNRVRVTGTVAEFTSTQDGVNSSETQLTNLTNVTNLGPAPLPTITTVTLPVTNVNDLERYEGMLVQVRAATGNLAVTEHYNLARYGQVTLSAADASNQPGTDARIDQFTQFNAPSVSGYAAYVAATAKRKIILDDASSVQNPATIVHARGGNTLSASNTLRGGDDVASLTAVLSERFDGYRLQTNIGVNFNPANSRPASLPNIGGSLKVAGANVLNFFNGPTFPTSRGADNATEFTRQQTKIVANLLGTGAAIIALSEIENDGYGAGSAIQDLVNGLNAATSPGTYTFVNAGTPSADEITVALVYKPGTVSAVGAAAIIPDNYGNGSFTTVGRKPIAQTFRHIATGGILTVVANHWKSKGSAATTNSYDQEAGDGQALSNGTRTRQAQDLLQWLATNPTGTTDPDYLILGDLNAYAREQPITTLVNGGYTPLLSDASYSFAFRGEWGSLDHALSTSSLAGQVSGATKWYINADEPRALDYNTEFKTASQVGSLFAPDPYRSADHDPLVVGFNLTGPNALSATLVASATAVCPGQPLTLTATVANYGSNYSYTITNGTNSSSASGVSSASFATTFSPTVPGAFTLTVLGSNGLYAVAVSNNVTVYNPPVVTISAQPGTTVTQGQGITLTASGANAGYTWSTGANSPSINPPTAATGTVTYSVTGLSTNGCSATAAVAITVLDGTCTTMFTIKAGLWSDPTVWSCNRVPLSTDPVTINHTVTVPASYQGFSTRISYGQDGKITYETGGRLRVGP